MKLPTRSHLSPTLHRWLRFNLVGALGMAVQLTALALLNQALHGHYLLASAVAVELAILHNFLWHVFYTWRDRRHSTSVFASLLRFHLSNGLVSLLGGLALMRLFAHHAHIPVVVANLLTIACCSLANFYLGNAWAFAPHIQAA